MGGGTHEVELKLQVEGAAALEKIAGAAGGGRRPCVRQKNHFFDAEDMRLRKSGFVLRLREEAGQWILTAKGRTESQGSGALTRRREEEVVLDEETGRAILDGNASPVAVLEERAEGEEGRALARRLTEVLAGAWLTYLGCFENERTRIATRLESEAGPFEAVLELDRTTFPGERVHYEVEMEVPAGVEPGVAEAAFRALFARAGVEGRPQRGKASRFFDFLALERKGPAGKTD